MIALMLLACGRSAPPPVPIQPAAVMVSLASITEAGTATVQLSARAAWILERAQCAVWQDGVMLDTVQISPEVALSPHQPVRLNLSFEGLERGPVQLTGSLHLTGALGAQELVLVELSGQVEEGVMP